MSILYRKRFAPIQSSATEKDDKKTIKTRMEDALCLMRKRHLLALWQPLH